MNHFFITTPCYEPAFTIAQYGDGLFLFGNITATEVGHDHRSIGRGWFDGLQRFYVNEAAGDSVAASEV